MKAGHCPEILGQGFALAFLKLFEQEVNGLFNELLRGVLTFGGALLIGRVAAERRILPVRRGGGVGAGVRHVRLLRSLDLPLFSPGGLKKDICFIAANLGVERRCPSPKPVRGAEASTACSSPRGAAQAGWTEGAERSLEFARKRMSRREDQPKAAPFQRDGVAGRNEAVTKLGDIDRTSDRSPRAAKNRLM